MAYETVRFNLASAVATGQTFTVSYPTGMTKSDFQLGTKHKMVAIQNVYTSPTDFTVSLGASSATITYQGATTLPAGSEVFFQLDKGGPDSYRSTPAYGLPARVETLHPVLLNLGSPIVADADGIFASASITAASPLEDGDFTGALASGGSVTLDVPRTLVAAWTNAAVMTITGTDDQDQVMVESSAPGTSFTGVKAFKTVTGVAVSANVTSCTIGTANILGLPLRVANVAHVLAEIEDGVLQGNMASPIRLPFVLEQVSLLAGTTAAAELVSPCAGVITGMTAVVRAAVTTGDTITAAVGTTAVDGLSISIADGATKGTTASDTPTAGHATAVVAKNSRIQVIPGNTFATAGAVDGFVEIRPTGTLSGTLVTALSPATKSTATTADVRGTYTPASTPDGSKAFNLLVLVADPNDLGNPQYAG